MPMNGTGPQNIELQLVMLFDKHFETSPIGWPLENFENLGDA